MFNEIMIMLQTYHIAIFSKFNLDEYSKFTLGKVYITIFGVTIAVNLINMFMKNYNNMRTKMRYKQIIKGKLAKQKILRVLKDYYKNKMI